MKHFHSNNSSYVYFPIKLLGHPDQLHLTVKYLGRDPVEVAYIEDTIPAHSLQWLVATMREWDLNLSGTMFTDLWKPYANPDKRRPVFVVRLSETPALNELHAALAPLRVDEWDQYNPHITVNASYWFKLNKYIRENGKQRAGTLITEVGPLTLKSQGKVVHQWAW